MSTATVLSLGLVATRSTTLSYRPCGLRPARLRLSAPKIRSGRHAADCCELPLSGLRQTRILGVRVDCLDMTSALDRIESFAGEGGHHLVATVNPEFVMRARQDHDFARVL